MCGMYMCTLCACGHASVCVYMCECARMFVCVYTLEREIERDGMGINVQVMLSLFS